MRKLNVKLAYRAKIIDFLLKNTLSPFIKDKLPKDVNDVSPKNILILDFHLIGDMVMLTPLLINIRQMYPTSVIGLVAGPWADAVLLNHPNLINFHFPIVSPWVKNISLFEGLINIFKCLISIRRHKWDLGIEVRGDLRQIVFMSFCRIKYLLGYDFTGGSWLLDFVVPDDGAEKHIIEHHYQIIKFLGSKIHLSSFLPRLWLSDAETISISSSDRYIGIHLGATHDLRRLPDLKALELIKTVLKYYPNRVVLFDAPDIVNLHNIFNLLDPAEKKLVSFYSGSLRDFIIMLSKCDLFIGMDSGGGHIAAALNVPTISIFGPSIPRLTSPVGKNIYYLESSDLELRCRPCNGNICISTIYKQCFQTINFKVINEILNNHSY